MSISGADIIVNMPSGVLVEIFTTWLCLPDVSRLDKSFCCHASRAHFLEALNCSEMVFHYTRDKLSTKRKKIDIENYLKWVVSRRIHVSQLKLPNYGNTIKRIQGNLFELTGKSLRDVLLSGSNGNITALLDVIASNCPQLVRFVVTNMLIGKSIRNVLLNCKHLEELRLDECKGLKPAFFTDLSCPKLQKIILSGVATDAILKLLTGACPNLTKLDASESPRLTANGIEVLALASPKLQVIDLYGNKFVTVVAMRTMLQNCINLTTLDISNCPLLGEACMLDISSSLKNLRKLYAQYNNYVTDAVLEAISNNNYATIDTLFIAGCVAVTDVGIENIAQKCTKLQRINLAGLEEITDLAVDQLAKRCLLLEELNLRGTSVGDLEMYSIAQYCKSLVKLDIGDCPNVTEQGAYYLTQYCTSLKELNISDDCEVVTPLVQLFWTKMRPNLSFSTVGLTYDVLS